MSEVTGHFRKLTTAGILALSLTVPALADQPGKDALDRWSNYESAVEMRLSKHHSSQENFFSGQLATPEGRARVRRGEQIIERVQPPEGTDLPGAMLHHWRGSGFAAGAKAADFEKLMLDFGSYPRQFAPQILKGQVLSRQGNHLVAMMRVKQKHIITIVMDTTYAIDFQHLDPAHGYSTSRSTEIKEIESAGTPKEHALSPEEEHGFLWRLNTYWSFEERDGGLYMQVETISLTRSIPTGLAWAIRPYIESVPRESLEFTLRKACEALKK